MSVQEKSSDATLERKDRLIRLLQDVIEDIKEEVRPYDASGKVQKHIERVLKYNVADPNGRLYGGIGAIHFYESYVPKEVQSEDNLRLATYIGCFVEMFKAVAYIVDDIVDGSPTRRKKPSWYTHKDVQLNAINDAFMLEAITLRLLKKHFSHLDCYPRLLDVFRESVFVGSIGEFLDIETHKQDPTTFTMEQYKNITNLKTCHIGYTKLILGFAFCGVTDPVIIEQAKFLFYDLGYLCQSQNDFTDCYSDPEIIGKVGTDIEEGKCTWLAIKFLEVASPGQKEIFKENYGKTDPLCVNRVKQLYNEVSMIDIFFKHEAEKHDELKSNPLWNSNLYQGFSHFFHKFYDFQLIEKKLRHKNVNSVKLERDNNLS